MEVVLIQEDSSTCRAPPGQGEYQSRLGVQTLERFQRLDAKTGDIPGSLGEVGPLLNRPVCLSTECPTPSILQLETQPSSPSSGCPVHLLERSTPIPLPSICTYWKVLAEDPAGRGGSSAHSSSLANTDLVPHTSRHAGGETSTTSQHTEHSPGPPWRASPLSPPRTPTSSRLVCLRKSYSNRGLSKRVTEMLNKSW